MIVLDASAVIELLLRTRTGERVENRIYAKPVKLHAPHLIDIEVAQVMRRKAIRQEITSARGEVMLQHFRNLTIFRHAHYDLLNRIWNLRHNLAAYDATYVALAEALDAPLLTCDGKIAGTTNHSANVEFIPIDVN